MKQIFYGKLQFGFSGYFYKGSHFPSFSQVKENVKKNQKKYLNVLNYD